MGQYCFAGLRLSSYVVCLSSSSVVICNAAVGRSGPPPSAWAVWRPTLHGGPVRYVQLGRHLVLKVLIAHMNDCSKFTTTKWSVERYCAVFSTFWSVIVYWGGLSGDRWLQCVASACRIIFLLYIWYLALSDGQADANWSAINRVYVITRCPPRHWLRRRCSDVMAGATSLVVDESFDHQRSTKAPTTRQSQP